MLSSMRLTTTKHYSCGSSRTPAAQRILYAAAFGSLSGNSWAFVSPPSVPAVAMHPLKHGSTYHPFLPKTVAQHQQSRLFFSKRDDSNSDWGTFKRAGGNLLKKGANKIKSLIPFGKSKEEKRAEIMKKERKQEITGGINTMLKDAPLPIRMMGRMISPLLARAADQMAQQSKQAQEMLEEARVRMVNDPILTEQLGEPLQVGQPFSQSSSTMVINGNSSARVQASFQVAGPRGTGIATMESSNGEIGSLTVNVNGRNISVGSSRGGKVFGKSSGKTSSKMSDNIIEAEIIEKK
mmetsp:Transcript_16554/g.35788  ORF Transcript_16554/g.35788 Transcript_16554/m.35788 type:complete len:294 (-) Transcript_16554:2568-3449(-)